MIDSADTKSKTLILIITKYIKPDSVVYTNTFRFYNELDVTDFHHYRINHSKKFAEEKNHINDIKNFWNQVKRVLRKYNGIPRQYFHRFLNEYKFKFNYSTPKTQLNTLKK